jgi:hypothetical protein
MDFTNIEMQVLAGALSNYSEIEDLPEKLKNATETAKQKIKSELKKINVRYLSYFWMW